MANKMTKKELFYKQLSKKRYQNIFQKGIKGISQGLKIGSAAECLKALHQFATDSGTILLTI